MSIRFSEYFKLNKTQVELDFVDIPLNTDVTLFLDPYAFKIGDNLWSIECNDLIVDFFDEVISCILNNHHIRGRNLLGNHLGEPDGTNLGFSGRAGGGRGAGKQKTLTIYDRLKNSKAAQTGKLHDLSDCELLIPFVGPDTISDITINVIRKKLLIFTKDQCHALGIPTESVQGGACWSTEHSQWINGYADLPIYDNNKIILVPKTSVRYRLAVDPQEYYQRYVLEYLQAEHLSAGSSLVEVLKSGKRRVTKKSLKDKYPYSKDFLFNFSEEHPEVLKEYKTFLPNKSQPMSDQSIDDILQQSLNRPLNNFISGGIHMTNYNIGTNLGAVGPGAIVNARDISQFKQVLTQSVLPQDVQEILIKAREQLESIALPEGDKNDVADDIGKISCELAQSNPEPSRIKKIFSRIKENAPVIALILEGIKTIAAIL